MNIVFPTKNGEDLEVPIQFDSGATSFFIGHNLYKELKKSADIIDLNVKGISGGVGSEFDTKYIMIKTIKLSDYQINNVVAIVPLREDINDMLIGVGFLKKFKEVVWSLNSNLMRFYK
jgi:predicted aspartyl protease